MQTKTTMRYHLTLVRMVSSKSLQIINAGEGVEKEESCYSVGGNVNWCSHYTKQYGGSQKTLKIELPHDPAMPLLEKTKTNLKRCMHPNVHKSTIYNRQDVEQPRQPLTDNWLKIECLYVYSGMLLSHKQHETFTAAWMDPKTITLSGVRQRRINVIPYHLHMDSR